MTPTTQDLKALFDDVGSAAPVVGDLAGDAARRGRALRRRRMAVAAAGVAVAVAAVVAPNLPGGSAPTPPVSTPSPTPGLTEGDQPLPDYLRGGRLLSAAVDTGPQGVSLTFTPTTLDFGFAWACAVPGLDESQPNRPEFGMVYVAGRPTTGSSCGSQLWLDGTGDFTQPPEWSAYGVRVGEPVTVTLAPRRPVDTAADYGTARWRLAVYEGVPVDEYPFPEPPEQLSGLSASLLSHVPGSRLVASGRPAPDPTGFTYTVPVERGLTARIETVAPGTFRMYVNDRLVWTHHAWTYDVDVGETSLTLSELGVRAGDQVVLRFEADRFPPKGYAYVVNDAAPPAAR